MKTYKIDKTKHFNIKYHSSVPTEKIKFVYALVYVTIYCHIFEFYEESDFKYVKEVFVIYDVYSKTFKMKYNLPDRIDSYNLPYDDVFYLNSGGTLLYEFENIQEKISFFRKLKIEELYENI